MLLFSLHDQRPGEDRRTFLSPGLPAAEGLRCMDRADVRYYGRDDACERETVERGELVLVIAQGRARITIDDIEHPVSAFDVIVLGEGEAYSVRADDVDPAVILTLGAGR